MASKSLQRPTVLIHCQYVYGIGHFVRTVELARGLSQYFSVYILNGGEIIPNFELPPTIQVIQLPAIYKEEGLNLLKPVDPLSSIEGCLSMRGRVISHTMDIIKPDLLITEHFPFGLLFEEEVIELIKKVKRRNPLVKIISSVRDIIESNQGSKEDGHICNIIHSWYDLILVHGDEHFAPLSTSFPLASKLTVPILQTGYIVRERPTETTSTDPPIVLASVAGGRLGNELLDALVDSHRHTYQLRKHQLILFSGAFQKDYDVLSNKVSSLMKGCVKLFRFSSDDYKKYLSNASLVISLGGYNSVLESVSAKKSMLVYQRVFTANNEEQQLRIKLFKNAGLLDVIYPQDLQAAQLTNLIVHKLINLEVPDFPLNLDGVQNASKALIDLFESPNMFPPANAIK